MQDFGRHLHLRLTHVDGGTRYRFPTIVVLFAVFFLATGPVERIRTCAGR